MLKAGVVLIAICASTVGAAFWIESGVNPTRSQIAELAMPSLEELHQRAQVENLPVREVKEPF